MVTPVLRNKKREKEKYQKVTNAYGPGPEPPSKRSAQNDKGFVSQRSSQNAGDASKRSSQAKLTAK